MTYLHMCVCLYTLCISYKEVSSGRGCSDGSYCNSEGDWRKYEVAEQREDMSAG